MNLFAIDLLGRLSWQDLQHDLIVTGAQISMILGVITVAGLFFTLSVGNGSGIIG